MNQINQKIYKKNENSKKITINKKSTFSQKNNVEPESLFIQGPNTSNQIYATYSCAGALSGLSFGYGYSSNYFTHNIEYKNYKTSFWDTETSSNNLSSNIATLNVIDYKFDYHAFPQWYLNNKTKKIIDAGISASIGYGNFIDESNLKTPLVIAGFGGFVNYKLTNDIGLKTHIDILTPLNNKNINLGTAIGVGLSFGF